MHWLTEIGLGVLLGAVLVGLALFRGRGGRAQVPMALPEAEVQRLGYRSLGASTARRMQGTTPIVFDWSGPAPVWRTAASGDPAPLLADADVELLVSRLGGTVRGLEGRLEVVGGDAADPGAHLAAAELLVVLAGRLKPPA
ncbi:MAG: hypothetical protein R3F60_11145 [bacterium]